MQSMAESTPQAQSQPTPQLPPYIGYVQAAPAAAFQQASNNVNHHVNSHCQGDYLPEEGREREREREREIERLRIIDDVIPKFAC